MKYLRSPQIEAAPLKNELLLFHPQNNKFFVMNTTAAFLWERVNVPASEQELAEALCSSFAGISIELALADVGTTVRTMLELGLLIERDHNSESPAS